jgi:hypothetical protein
MGARVVVTPGETTPASFSHPLLPAFKVAPQPVVAEQAQGDAPVAAKADKGAPDKPATSLELRSTVGHSNAVTSVANMAPVTLRDQTHTADAADAKSMVTMSDAGGIATNGARTSGEKTDGANTDGAKAESVKADTAPTDRAPPIKDSPASAKPDDGASAETKPTDAQPVMADTSTGPAEAKPDAPKQDQARVEPTKPEPTKAEPSKSEPAKADAARLNDKLAEQPVKAASDGVASAPDDKKDQSRLAKPEVTKRTGQIAVFISRKDSKIYVRQNFAPLFDAPVTIAASDRPLGTHVFTAEVDKSDANALHWSVVSLPMSARGILRASDEEYGSRQRKNALASAEAKPLPLPDSPVEALDRISVPADTMARISEALTTGGSIIVSDQGINQGETGEGTDFIVSLR